MSSKMRLFYKEMDRNNRKNKEKTLSFWELILFFVVLIIICEGVVFGIGRAIRSTPKNDLAVQGGLSQGLKLISTSESNGEEQTSISQGALCSEIVKKIGRQVSCAIDTDGIVISGKVSALLPQNASVYIMPSVEGGRLKFDLTKVTIGSIGIAKFIGSPISSAINSVVGASLPSNTLITRIDLEPAVMVIVSKTQ